MKLLLLATALLWSYGTAATPPAPYIEAGDGRSATEAFALVHALHASSCARTSYFDEVHQQTGYSEDELVQAATAANMMVRPCGSGCTLETAGLIGCASVYWRRVKADEPVAYVRVHDTWVPFMLPRCANPVRPVARPSTSRSTCVNCTAGPPVNISETRSTSDWSWPLGMYGERTTTDTILFYPTQNCVTGGKQ